MSNEPFLIKNLLIIVLFLTIAFGICARVLREIIFAKIRKDHEEVLKKFQTQPFTSFTREMTEDRLLRAWLGSNEFRNLNHIRLKQLHRAYFVMVAAFIISMFLMFGLMIYILSARIWNWPDPFTGMD